MYRIDVRAAAPEDDDLDKVAVFGAVPGVFNLAGGAFAISASPVDDAGEMLPGPFDVDNFGFNPRAPTATPTKNPTLRAWPSARSRALRRP